MHHAVNVNHARRAFTLLELILVLVVLGIVSAVAAARLSGLRTAQGVDLAAQQVLDQARRCQHLAVAQGQTVRLRFDLDALTTTVQVIDPAGVKDPSDGLQADTLIYEGVLALTANFVPDDGKPITSGLVDLLFLPDAICDQPGVFTMISEGRQAAVRCHLGGQPPSLEPVL